jgi:hypothetical protein
VYRQGKKKKYLNPLSYVWAGNMLAAPPNLYADGDSCSNSKVSTLTPGSSRAEEERFEKKKKKRRKKLK